MIARSVAAETPPPASTPTPSFLYGSTPANGCPRFFIRLTLAQVDACADRLADAGWGLSAETYSYLDDDPVDYFSGAFEPREPKRWLESDLQPIARQESENGFVVDVASTTTHLVTEYQRGHAHTCDAIDLYRPYDLQIKDVPRYFAKVMSQNAAEGCVPGRFYSLIRPEAIHQENPDTHVAFVPGDPHTTAATWPRNDAERAAFEKRAAARGFFRLSLSDPPDRWGKTAGPRYVETLRFTSQASGYAALQRRLELAIARGERVVDLNIARATDDDTAIAKITFLWERAP